MENHFYDKDHLRDNKGKKISPLINHIQNIPWILSETFQRVLGLVSAGLDWTQNGNFVHATTMKIQISRNES